MAHYNTSQLAMDEVYSWIMNCKNATMNSKIVHCNYAYDAISGALNSGSFLLIGFRNGSYAHITAHSYWGARAISIGTIENGAWASRFDRVITNTDLDTRLPTYYSLNGVTKIKNLPYGIYNLGNSDILKLTDKPSELAGGRCLLITSGASSYDEKVALILASTHQSGGIYFGHIWGTSVNEFAWKKVIGNA